MKLGYYFLAAALAISPSVFASVQWTGLGQVVVTVDNPVCIIEHIRNDYAQKLILSTVSDNFPICDRADPNCKNIFRITGWHNSTQFQLEYSYRGPKEKFPGLDRINEKMDTKQYVTVDSWMQCYSVQSDNKRSRLIFYASAETPPS